AGLMKTFEVKGFFDGEKELYSFKSSDNIPVCISPDNKWVLCRSQDMKKVVLLDLTKGSTGFSMNIDEAITKWLLEKQVFSFTPDGRKIVIAVWERVGDQDVISRLEFRNPTTWELTSTFKKSDYAIKAFSVSPDSKRIVTAGLKDSIILWDLRTGEEIIELPTPHEVIESVLFSPDGQYLTTAGYKGGHIDIKKMVSVVNIWDTRDPPIKR
ncbi:MAG TPA: hypothetical protein VGZ25_09645, partial [Gemmataceae bacterium]|nr:hypothetical protein [Gemmataceae bacterium]